jgi:hypothetical protein
VCDNYIIYMLCGCKTRPFATAFAAAAAFGVAHRSHRKKLNLPPLCVHVYVLIQLLYLLIVPSVRTRARVCILILIYVYDLCVIYMIYVLYIYRHC